MEIDTQTTVVVGQAYTDAGVYTVSPDSQWQQSVTDPNLTPEASPATVTTSLPL